MVHLFSTFIPPLVPDFQNFVFCVFFRRVDSGEHVATKYRDYSYPPAKLIKRAASMRKYNEGHKRAQAMRWQRVKPCKPWRNVLPLRPLLGTPGLPLEQENVSPMTRPMHISVRQGKRLEGMAQWELHPTRRLI